MIRTTANPRTIRYTAVAALGVAGALALAGCASTAEAEQPADTGTSDSGSSTDTGDATGTYADGTYEAEGSYQTPESVETIDVSITLADGVVSAVEVTGDPQKPESERYQGEFIGGIADEVVGKSLDEISVSRVAGSSLTSGGFNEALETIKAEAAA
ncbi:MAG: hypothetical protein ABW024_09145 [Microbacterium sp.]